MELTSANERLEDQIKMGQTAYISTTLVEQAYLEAKFVQYNVKTFKYLSNYKNVNKSVIKTGELSDFHFNHYISLIKVKNK